MTYKYDVFFSYKRDPESDEWHRSVMEKLRFWLGHHLVHNAQIFFDKQEVRTGLQWKNTIEQALRISKTIVCVWSPLYFQSKWCVSEWRTFMAREQAANCDLIMPASFIDGEHFPNEAKAKQYKDFSSYTSTLPTFWQTALAVSFENDLIKPFARDLAALIKSAPPYNSGFPVVLASDEEVLQEAVIRRIANV